jgi:hypothetical protein
VEAPPNANVLAPTAANTVVLVASETSLAISVQQKTANGSMVMTAARYIKKTKPAKGGRNEVSMENDWEKWIIYILYAATALYAIAGIGLVVGAILFWRAK